jgi:hypothetical protein
MTYLPPKIPNPQRDREKRQQTIRSTVTTILWLAAIPPLLFAVMALGYSDQAPAFMRDIVIAVDSFFGSPVWDMIGPKK